MLITAFVFSLLGGRLVQLQVFDRQAYAADGSLTPEQIQIPAKRGEILDSSGNPLAMTVDAYDITADPAQIAGQQASPATIASELAKTLNAAGDKTSVATLRRQLSTSGSHFELLARQVSVATWQAITKLNLIGIYSESDPRRVYVPGGIAASVVGFVNDKGQGAGGLELMDNKLLSGRPGSMSYEVAEGSQVPVTGVNEKPAVSGSSIETTINADIQYEAQQDIAQVVASSHASSGAIVVEDVHTGQLLAVADAPSFDPNDITQADVPNLASRAFDDEYEPGSVGKLMTVSAAIQHGYVSPRTELLVPPCIDKAHICFHDDSPHGYEHLTVTGMLAESSNIGAIMVGDQFPAATRDQLLYDTFRQFGMGQTTGIGYPGETAGDLPPPSQWNASQRYTIVFGQGYDLTAVQATSMLATIANGGVRVPPTLVKGMVSPSGTFHAATPPKATRVISASTARQVADMMQAVVSPQGTAPDAAIPGYLVAGKTGTAYGYSQTLGAYAGYTASFAGFAPADKPAIAVYAEVSNPQGAHYGDQLAAPVVQKVMSFALQDLGVPPTGGKPANLPITW
jgi:cell division protein FtsI (penicillin-binding protein 3)